MKLISMNYRDAVYNGSAELSENVQNVLVTYTHQLAPQSSFHSGLESSSGLNAVSAEISPPYYGPPGVRNS